MNMTGANILLLSFLLLISLSVAKSNCNSTATFAKLISNLQIEFTSKIEEILQENRQLKIKVSDLENDLTDVNAKVDLCLDGQGLKSSKNGSGVLNRRNNFFSRQSDSVIAFHAYLSHGIQNIGYHHTIPFDQEMTDVGNGYNQYSNTFTVPETGIYVFSWTITVRGTLCATQLVQNASVIGESYSDSEHDEDNATATEIVIKQMNADDVVFVRARTGCSSIRSDTVIRSSFSGWKL